MGINSKALYGRLSSIPQTSNSEKQQIIDTILNEEFKDKRKPHEIDLFRQKLKDKALLTDKSYSSAKLTKKVKKKKSEYKLTHKTRRLKELNLHDIPKEGQKYEFIQLLRVIVLTHKFDCKWFLVLKSKIIIQILLVNEWKLYQYIVN